MNRYLRDRASRRGMIQNQGRGQEQRQNRMDGHHPHYPRKTMREMERMQMQQYPQQYPMDMEYDYAKYDSRYNSNRRGQDGNYPYQQYGERNRPMEYEMYGYGIGGIKPMDYGYDYNYDYARGGNRMRDRNYDYNYGYDYDYASEDMEKEWKEHLKKWQDELKRYDRFNIPKEQIIQNARQMGATFEDYNEDEFYTTYLMIVSDNKKSISDPHIAILQTQEWLEDDDSKLKGSDKLCAYYYEVINAGEED